MGGTSIYLLGSLFFFYFTGVSATHILRTKLQGTTLTNSSFSADLPHLQHAFEEALSDLRAQVSAYAGALTDEIVLMVKQLCDPDPTKRGDPRWKGSLVASYDLQTYISKLDRLYRRVEVNLR